MDMRTIDLSPLYRASVGFDRLVQTLDSVSQESALSYPPYNIEKVTEAAYRISMAVAGFGEGELDVTAKENSLVLTGSKSKPAEGHRAHPREHRLKSIHTALATGILQRPIHLPYPPQTTGADLSNAM